jgi:hypothetical protein
MISLRSIATLAGVLFSLSPAWASSYFDGYSEFALELAQSEIASHQQQISALKGNGAEQFHLREIAFHEDQLKILGKKVARLREQEQTLHSRIYEMAKDKLGLKPSSPAPVSPPSSMSLEEAQRTYEKAMQDVRRLSEMPLDFLDVLPVATTEGLVASLIVDREWDLAEHVLLNVSARTFKDLGFGAYLHLAEEAEARLGAKRVRDNAASQYRGYSKLQMQPVEKQVKDLAAALDRLMVPEIQKTLHANVVKSAPTLADILFGISGKFGSRPFARVFHIRLAGLGASPPTLRALDIALQPTSNDAYRDPGKKEYAGLFAENLKLYVNDRDGYQVGDITRAVSDTVIDSVLEIDQRLSDWWKGRAGRSRGGNSAPADPGGYLGALHPSRSSAPDPIDHLYGSHRETLKRLAVGRAYHSAPGYR